jgi:hypothetical protein
MLWIRDQSSSICDSRIKCEFQIREIGWKILLLFLRRNILLLHTPEECHAILKSAGLDWSKPLTLARSDGPSLETRKMFTWQMTVKSNRDRLPFWDFNLMNQWSYWHFFIYMPRLRLIFIFINIAISSLNENKLQVWSPSFHLLFWFLSSIFHVISSKCHFNRLVDHNNSLKCIFVLRISCSWGAMKYYLLILLLWTGSLLSLTNNKVESEYVTSENNNTSFCFSPSEKLQFRYSSVETNRPRDFSIHFGPLFSLILIEKTGMSLLEQSCEAFRTRSTAERSRSPSTSQANVAVEWTR